MAQTNHISCDKIDDNAARMKALKEKKEAKKAEEERLRKENAEMRKKLKQTGTLRH